MVMEMVTVMVILQSAELESRLERLRLQAQQRRYVEMTTKPSSQTIIGKGFDDRTLNYMMGMEMKMVMVMVMVMVLQVTSLRFAAHFQLV